MNVKAMIRLLVMTASVMALVLSFAPVSFAGEDDDDDQPAQSSGGGGGGDTGSASGGAQTGFGGAVADANGNMRIPLMLAGGGVLVLTAASGLAFRREQRSE